MFVPVAGILLFLESATGLSGPIIETGPYTLSLPENFGTKVYIPENNPLTKEGVYLGKMLFYETRLSSTNKISCGSCHQQQLAFTDGKAFSEGVYGQLADRNAMTLANLLWVKNLFWDGRVMQIVAL